MIVQNFSYTIPNHLLLFKILWLFFKNLSNWTMVVLKIHLSFEKQRSQALQRTHEKIVFSNISLTINTYIPSNNLINKSTLAGIGYTYNSNFQYFPILFLVTWIRIFHSSTWGWEKPTSGFFDGTSPKIGIMI